jgi:hypothetical protein
MTRVVLDSNVIVSAYLNPHGQPFRVLKLALVNLVRLCAPRGRSLTQPRALRARSADTSNDAPLTAHSWG